MRDVVQAAAILSFEYDLLIQYAKEQVALEEYTKKCLLEEEFKVKIAACKIGLEADSDKFNVLISKVFAPELWDFLRASCELTLAVGVRGDEILRNLNDVDTFL